MHDTIEHKKFQLCELEELKDCSLMKMQEFTKTKQNNGMINASNKGI